MSEFRNTPEEARKLWVEALRSGEFEQCTEQLRIDDGDEDSSYCCLGVACALFERHEGEHAAGFGVDWGPLGSLLYTGSVRQWLGLRSNEGDCVRRDGLPASLVELNDDGSTFAEIADVIESEPTGLFVEPSNA